MKGIKITCNVNLQYGRWRPSWISTDKIIFQHGSISSIKTYIEKYQYVKFQNLPRNAELVP